MKTICLLNLNFAKFLDQNEVKKKKKSYELQYMIAWSNNE